MSVKGERMSEAQPSSANPTEGGTRRADGRGVVTVADLPVRSQSSEHVEKEPPEPYLSIPNGLAVPSDAYPATEDLATDRGPELPGAASITDDFTALRIGLFNPPMVSASFLAVDDTGSAVPDVSGAVGPSHLVATHNGLMRIQEKNVGGVLTTVSLSNFWSPAGAVGGVFDPRILFDPDANRWVTVAVDSAQSASSGILVGVSQTDDPMGSWNLYRVALGAFNAWADRPNLGMSNGLIIIQVNIFAGTTFFASRVYTFFASDLYAGGAGLFYVYGLSPTAGASQVPVTGSSSAGSTYFLQHANGNSNGRGFVRIWRLGFSVTPEIYVSTPAPWDFTAPGGANLGPQFNSGQKIQLNDARFDTAYCMPGVGEDYLFSVHTVFLPAGGSAVRSAIQFWVIRTDGSPAGTRVDQVARIDDPTGGACFAYPSLAVNPVTRTVIIGFLSFYPNRYPSAEWAFRWGSDAPNVLRRGGLTKSGEGPYDRTGSGGRNRWGDYTSTVFDPSDGSMWTLQEYSRPAQGSGNLSGRWGTWWTQFQLGEIP
jgi:hypothetical protein